MKLDICTTGKLVKRLEVRGRETIWDGSEHTSGVYFARVGAGDCSSSVKILLLK